MHNKESIIDTVLLTIGSTYSLANIEHILGIIILVIQLAWIMCKLVVKIINTIKSKQPLETCDKDVGSVIDTIVDFTTIHKSREDYLKV